MDLAEQILREVAMRGVKTVFGVPGRENASILFNEVPGVQYVTTRNEFAAGMMAAQMGRMTGVPHIAFCTMGPGATNMATPVATAMLNHSPMILISAQLESDDRFYNETHQCLDQRAVMEPITKWSYELEHPSDLATILDEAFRAAAAEPPGPVHLSIPADFFTATVTAGQSKRGTRTERTESLMIDEFALHDIRDRLREAQRPLCILGDEITRTGTAQAAVEFCELWNIPVILGANAKGAMPHEHPLNLGSATPYMEGILGADVLGRIFDDVDVILTIGLQYVDDILPKMWTRGRPKTVLCMSERPLHHARQKVQPDSESIGSLPNQLQFLAELGAKPFPSEVSHSFDWLRDVYRQRQERALSRTTLDPISVLSVLNERLRHGASLVTDIGFYRHHAILFSEPNEIGRFFTETALSSFGVGLGAAMAMQLHRPTEDVFLIAGDGGFHSTSSDLATAARYGIPVVVIVLNSDSFELIGRYQERGGKGSHHHAVQLQPVDFVKLAEANGCVGATATSRDQLAALLDNRDRSRPLVVDVPCDYDEQEQFYESF